jgi:hypothetical protein
MTQAYNLSQLANFVNSSGQLDASTGLTNTSSLGFPSGTRMSFNQTSAPTGWTKDTATAINDSILRLVTGSVSSGGSVAFSTWNASGVTGATTLTTDQIPNHSHFIASSTSAGSDLDYGNNIVAATSTNFRQAPAADTSGIGGGNSHTHTLSNNVKYYDFIIAQKD